MKWIQLDELEVGDVISLPGFHPNQIQIVTVEKIDLNSGEVGCVEFGGRGSCAQGS